MASPAPATTPQSTLDLVRRVQRGECLRSRTGQYILEKFVMAGLVGCAMFSVGITFAIILVLFGESLRFFALPEVSVSDFFLGLKWNPLLGSQKHFGIWPLICGTFVVTMIAMLVALPLGLVSAIYLSEYAPRRVRSILKPVLEILAGIPTVVYGFFALGVISPFLRDWLHIPGVERLNALSAGIAVGILCIPVVCSLAEDALRAVPRALRDGALGLGGTKFDVAIKVVTPAALSGIISAFLLAIARATGETMVVALAAGNLPQLTVDPRQTMQTMTGYMAQMATGDVSNFGAEYYSMYAVAAVLFTITFTITVIGQIVRKRYRETYK
ncbi:MAG TPA: phosphate ABC transporter permease subunit PstC [Pirellulaceae bacterium]|nr:phosphate ABC transporter permease subunit PstC [Pirellulaceae bacterium]